MALRTYGICEEEFCRYSKKNLSRRPSRDAYARASQFSVHLRQIQQTLPAMKTSLANQVPFVVTILMSKSAKEEADENYGYVSIPNLEDSNVMNSVTSHAVLVVGYDDRTKHFLVRNSWGVRWVRIHRNID